jgi:hypothetical protein
LVQKENNEREREKRKRKSNLPVHPVANYPLIASNGPKLMDEIQWLKKIYGTIQWLRNGT